MRASSFTIIINIKSFLTAQDSTYKLIYIASHVNSVIPLRQYIYITLNGRSSVGRGRMYDRVR